MNHIITYKTGDDAADVMTVTLPGGRVSEEADLPDGGLGIITVGDETFVVVTPEYEGENDKLLHDTVYKLVAVPTEVVGDFPEFDEDGDDAGAEDDEEDDDE